MPLIIGTERDDRTPRSPYAGLHPTLAARAKALVTQEGIAPVEAIDRVESDYAAFVDRIQSEPWNVPEVTAYCEQEYQRILRAHDPEEVEDLTLVDVRAGVYRELRRRSHASIWIVGAITGVQDGEFQILPNGELVRT